MEREGTFSKAFNLAKIEEVSQMDYEVFLETIVQELWGRFPMHIIHQIGDKVYESPVLQSTADGEYYDLVVTSKEGACITFRFSMCDLYLVGFKIGDDWYYFEGDIHGERFKRVFGDKATSLRMESNYDSFGEEAAVGKLHFDYGSFNNNINKLFGISFPLKKHHKKAMTFMIVALSEAVRFPAIRKVTAESFNPLSTPENPPILSSFEKFLILCRRKSSERIGRKTMRQGQKTMQHSGQWDKMNYLSSGGRAIMLQDVLVLKIPADLWISLGFQAAMDFAKKEAHNRKRKNKHDGGQNDDGTIKVKGTPSEEGGPTWQVIIKN